MRIGIICAMQEELDAIVDALGVNYATTHDRSFTTATASYPGHEVIFILSGIGKVNAASHTQYLIDRFKPDIVINVGVAGSLTPDLKFGDVIIAHDLVQHDMDVSAFGMKLGQIPRMEVFAFKTDETLLSKFCQLESDEYQIVVGRIATGDKFIDDKDGAEFINQEFNALACEMEGAAIAHVCYLNQIPFVVVRALSDMAGQSDVAAIRSYTELKDMSAARAAHVVQHLLKLI